MLFPVPEHSPSKKRKREEVSVILNRKIKRRLHVPESPSKKRKNEKMCTSDTSEVSVTLNRQIKRRHHVPDVSGNVSSSSSSRNRRIARIKAEHSYA